MQDLLIPTKIVRSKRRSIALVIENNGDFIVRAPLLANDASICKFINQKRDWIINKRTEQLINRPKQLNCLNNETISILGANYLIKLCNVARIKVADNIIYIPEVNSKEKLINYLKKFAKQVITNQTELVCKEHNLNYTSISINSAKTRWGSCSGNNKLHFTYKLMLCPIDVVKYIVIHELCHTKVKNHSNKFWELVQIYCPEYRMCEKWLKKNRAIVDVI